MCKSNPRPGFSDLLETTGSSQGLPESHEENYSDPCLDCTGDAICQSSETLPAFSDLNCFLFSGSLLASESSEGKLGIRVLSPCLQCVLTWLSANL